MRRILLSGLLGVKDMIDGYPRRDIDGIDGIGGCRRLLAQRLQFL
jgi:hypothetical protein